MAVSKLQTSTRPSNADIVRAITELHDCVHGVDRKIDGVDRKVDGVVADVGQVKERVAKVEGFQSGIATHLRVPAAGEKISFWVRWKGPIGLAGAVFGALAAFVACYPLLRVIFLAMDVYLTTAK